MLDLQSILKGSLEAFNSKVFLKNYSTTLNCSLSKSPCKLSCSFSLISPFANRDNLYSTCACKFPVQRTQVLWKLFSSMTWVSLKETGQKDAMPNPWQLLLPSLYYKPSWRTTYVINSLAGWLEKNKIKTCWYFPLDFWHCVEVYICFYIYTKKPDTGQCILLYKNYTKRANKSKIRLKLWV